MILDRPTKTALQTLNNMRNELVRLMNKRQPPECICRFSNQLWALNKIEELIYSSDKAPLDIIEEFGYKMKVYSAINKEFEDCWIEAEVLVDFLTC